MLCVGMSLRIVHPKQSSDPKWECLAPGRSHPKVGWVPATIAAL